jgi:hypothetical protein
MRKPLSRDLWDESAGAPSIYSVSRAGRFNPLGTTNHFAVDPIHVDGFESHAIRRDSALAPHKNLNV